MITSRSALKFDLLAARHKDLGQLAAQVDALLARCDGSKGGWPTPYSTEVMVLKRL